MLSRFHDLFLDAGLVSGASCPGGWGQVIRRQILPLLCHPKLAHHAEILREGLSRADNPASVLVVGEGNFGKSTLVNALVGTGEEIAQCDFLPLTWQITRYVPSHRGARLEVHYDASHGSAGRLEDLVRNNGFAGRAALDNGLIRFEQLDDLQRLMAHEETARGKGAGSAIWQVVRSIDSAGDVSALELIDSPGISQDRRGSAAAESIEDFYFRADVVLWLLAADKPNSQETRTALKSMARYGKPIIGIINRADLIPANRRQQVLEDVRQRFGELLCDVLLLSARDAFDGIASDDRDRIAASGLPELRRAIQRLAGAAGRRTKALSLYNTGRQAASEAATILRHEADVLESNVEKFRTNVGSANQFQARGAKVLRSALQGQSGVIAAALANTMKRTFVAYGDADTLLWDFEQFNQTLRVKKSELIDRVNTALTKELADVQDEIAVREYVVQSYRDNATVKSHESRTSLACRMEEVQHELRDYEFKSKWSMTDILAGVGGWIRDGWERLIGKQVTVAERREREKRDRQRALDACIRGLNDLEDEVHNHVKSIAGDAVSNAVAELTAEVTDCFQREFESESAAIQRIADYRGNADAAVVPPAISFTVRNLLKTAPLK